MAFINWDDTLSVNVKELDNQHKTLVSMINELSDAMKDGKGKEQVGVTINGLVDYTIDHFMCEEKYFAKYRYPENDAHVREHNEFISKVVEFKDGFESGKLSLSIEVMHFLKDWIFKHIKVTDKKYSGFLNQNGLK